MKITLGATVLVNTLDSASGVWPSLTNEVQVARFLRGAWADFWVRGGRLYTLPLTVCAPPDTGYGASLAAMFERLEATPDEGALTIEEGNRTVIFSKAAVQNGRVVKRAGVSVSYEFTLLLRGPAEIIIGDGPDAGEGGAEDQPDEEFDHAVTLSGEDGATMNGELILVSGNQPVQSFEI
jgi:hypothetical protein